MADEPTSDVVRLTWSKRLREDAGHEFRVLANRARFSRLIRWCKRRSWAVEGWLMAWTEGVEPADHADHRLLAEDDDGDWLVPHRFVDGEPYWKGYWRWWRPDHWPVYVRSRRTRSYVMVERWQ